MITKALRKLRSVFSRETDLEKHREHLNLILQESLLNANELHDDFITAVRHLQTAHQDWLSEVPSAYWTSLGMLLNEVSTICGIILITKRIGLGEDGSTEDKKELLN